MSSRTPLVIAIVLLILPLLYVGSYLVLVNPGPPWHYDFDAKTMLFPTRYRCGVKCAECVFWPLEQIDRKSRPAEWDGSSHLTPAQRAQIKAIIRARKSAPASGSARTS